MDYIEYVSFLGATSYDIGKGKGKRSK